jgi:ethanolamine ammonia-lyase small subunit
MTKTAILRQDETAVDLREMTDARVSLGRFGAGIPTRAAQAFLLDHARARQAVWSEVDRGAIGTVMTDLGFAVVEVESLAVDRSTYVRRPDLGRKLAETSAVQLSALAGNADVAIIVADGLSASAVSINAVAMVRALAELLTADGLTIAPIVLAAQARVAIGDPVGEALGAKLTIVLIGERPGLSASDSLGAYITYDPKTGTADSRRNCISNIREGGMSITAAAHAATGLARDMLRTGISGIGLKDASAKLASPDPVIP